MVIRCGWCGKDTANRDRCTSCGHEDPARPWVQRGQEPPVVAEREAGRPALTDTEIRARLAAVPGATDEALAVHWDVDPRTIRRWRAKVSG